MEISKVCSSFILNNIELIDIEKISDIESVSLLCKSIISQISNVSLDLLKTFIKNTDINPINTSNIPQYSSFYNGTIFLIKTLRMAGNYGPTFEELGQHLLGANKKKAAYIKYGENHAKLAQLYDLAYIKKEKSSRVFLSSLGKEVEKLNENVQKEILIKFSLKIPIIQKCIKDDIENSNDIIMLLTKYLSKTTAIRRKSNVITILKMLS